MGADRGRDHWFRAFFWARAAQREDAHRRGLCQRSVGAPRVVQAEIRRTIANRVRLSMEHLHMALDGLQSTEPPSRWTW